MERHWDLNKIQNFKDVLVGIPKSDLSGMAMAGLKMQQDNELPQ